MKEQKLLCDIMVNFLISFNRKIPIFSLVVLCFFIIFSNIAYAETDYQMPEWVKIIATWWMDDELSDDEFLNSVKFLVAENIIDVPEDSIIHTSDLPDWLVHNAGWWHARIFTNSDFSNFDSSYIDKNILLYSGGWWGNIPEDIDTIADYDKHGFRTNIPSEIWNTESNLDITEKKPEKTYRIFAVGGSTTFGVDVNNHETWPSQLEKKFQDLSLDFNIQVINAGKNGSDTRDEAKLIENYLLNFEPDMIIMYSGWNDSLQANGKPVIYPIDTIRNWKIICELGIDKGFDTVVILQPVTGSGNRILTTQESMSSVDQRPENFYFKSRVLDHLPIIAQNLHTLNDDCSKVLDFTHIFDYIQAPIYYDAGHNDSYGHKLISENIFSQIVSIVSPSHENSPIKNYFSISNTTEHVVFSHSSDLSKKNFDNLDLTNSIFYKTNLSYSSFKNTTLDGVLFKGSNLTGVDLSRINLSGKDLSGTILIDQDLSGKDLSGTILVHADLSGTILTGANLSNSILAGQDLSKKDLTGTILTGADLTNTILP